MPNCVKLGGHLVETVRLADNPTMITNNKADLGGLNRMAEKDGMKI